MNLPLSVWVVAALAAIIVGAVAAERDALTLDSLRFNPTRAVIAGALAFGFCLLASFAA